MQNNADCLFPLEKRIHFREIDSTNKEARRLLNKRSVAELEGTVLTADFQSAGKGRVEDRRFYSPAGTGLYMSIILRPTDSLITSDLITPAAGVAVCRTIEKLSGQKTLIKWVNDIILDGKKVCGILTEGSLSPDGKIEALIIGIGVNIREPEEGFPDELRDIVTAVVPSSGKAGDYKNITTDSFLKELLDQLALVFDGIKTDETIAEYQRRSLVVGKRITVLAGNSTYIADVLEVTKQCHLIVRTVEESPDKKTDDAVTPEEKGVTASSEIRELLSGEVSLRLI